MAEQTPGGLNEQVPSLDGPRPRTRRVGCVLPCVHAVRAMSAGCALFHRSFANSPKRECTKPCPTRLTALLRAFSNEKRPNSSRAHTPQRPTEEAIDQAWLVSHVRA